MAWNRRATIEIVALQRRRQRRHGGPAVGRLQAPLQPLLRLADRGRQVGRDGALAAMRGVGEGRHLALDHAVEPRQHGHRLAACGLRRRIAGAGTRHHPRLVADQADIAGVHGGAARATDQRPQIDLRQHPVGHQQAVRLVIGLLHQQAEFLVQHRLHVAQPVVGQTRLGPGLDDDARQHVAAQQVVRVELLALLEQRDAGTQVVELGAGPVHDGQRQA
jgi:hypothetical protein